MPFQASGQFVTTKSSRLSQVAGCEGFCDYRAICRIRQARQAAKGVSQLVQIDSDLAAPKKPGPQAGSRQGKGLGMGS